MHQLRTLNLKSSLPFNFPWRRRNYSLSSEVFPFLHLIPQSQDCFHFPGEERNLILVFKKQVAERVPPKRFSSGLPKQIYHFLPSTNVFSGNCDFVLPSLLSNISCVPWVGTTCGKKGKKVGLIQWIEQRSEVNRSLMFSALPPPLLFLNYFLYYLSLTPTLRLLENVTNYWKSFVSGMIPRKRFTDTFRVTFCRQN